MTKLYLKKLAFIGLLILFCHLNIAGSRTGQHQFTSSDNLHQILMATAAQTRKLVLPTPDEPNQQRESVVKPSDETSNIAASIGDYVITRQELENRLMTELYPYGYETYNEQAKPPDAKTVLMKMLAEKAMVTEARKQDYLKDETLSESIKQFKEKRLVNLLLQKQLEPKLTVTESEIQEKMKADPKLDRARAEAMLKRAKAGMLFEQYYRYICQKFHMTKLSENFLKAAQIHQRLLTQPKKPRDVPFIRIYQITEDLTPEEKDIVLATFDNGKVTLKDWFDTLCESAPPSRPRDLDTTKGVESLLDRALRMPLLISEATSLGLENDKSLLQQVREYEDSRLLYKAKSEKYKEIKEPTPDEIMLYFGKNREVFRKDLSLKIDLIWCQDLKTAQQVKAELDSGTDFESVRKKYSLEKEGKPFNTYPSGEGLFWKDLWKGDPNDIVGPIKGFYQRSIKWRIVKILEKNPGKLVGYSNDMEQRVKERIVSEQRDALLAKYSDELLKKYPYKIYTERIKDIDPLDIP